MHRIVQVATLVLILSFAAAAQSTQGLVLSYSFDGNAYDASGNGNHGIVSGVVLTTGHDGSSNSAYSFSGGTHIRVPNSPSLNPSSEFTIAAWINYRGGSPNPRIFSKARDNFGYEFGVLESWYGGVRKLFMHIGGQRLESNGVVPTDGWHHVCVTKSDTQISFFIDGELDASRSYSGAIANTQDDGYIGRQMYNSFCDCLNGDLDEVRIYNRALSAAEVSAIYEQTGLPQPPTVTLVSPRGGKTWVIGCSELISWTTAGGPLTGLQISTSRDGGLNWESIYGLSCSSCPSFILWDVTGPVSNSFRVKVEVMGIGGNNSAISGGLSVVENVSPKAKELLQLLTEKSNLPSGSPDKILSGQFAGFASRTCTTFVTGCLSNNECLDYNQEDFVKSFTRLISDCNRNTYIPAIAGVDLGFSRTISPEDWSESAESLINHAERGGYVTVSWHAKNPWNVPGENEESPNGMGGSIDSLVSRGNTKYESFRKELDYIADRLRVLKDRDGHLLPILWRPFHEMNQTKDGHGLFWWSNLSGSNGNKAAYQTLWQYCYHYMKCEKGLNNLLWVWAPDDSRDIEPEWYPGDGFVDVVGLDKYGDEQIDNYSAILNIAPNKPFGLTEYGGGTSDGGCEPENKLSASRLLSLISSGDYPRLCFFQAWSSPWALGDTPDDARKLLRHEAVVNLGENSCPLAITTLSPVGLTVIDPLERTISSSINEIPNSWIYSYPEADNDSGQTAILFEPLQGIYRVIVAPKPGADEQDTYSIRYTFATDTVYLVLNEPISSIPEEPRYISTLDTGSLNGYVTVAGVGLPDISIDLADSYGSVISSTETDEQGHYSFNSLLNGNYVISIVVPLGFTANSETEVVSVRGLAHGFDFELTNLQITPQQRSRSYWSHQLLKALQNKPQDYSLAMFANFTNLINQHFNNNPINPVDFYQVPQPASDADSLEVLQKLLHMINTSADEPLMQRLAKSELMALMLNVVSGKVSQTHIASRDGSTISQVITYCDMLVNDEITPANDGGPGCGSPWLRYIRASFILALANSNLKVPSGMIPANVAQILYRQGSSNQLPTAFALKQNYPNPFNPSTTIAFDLPKSQRVSLEIINVLGQKVVTIVDTEMPAGSHEIAWDGRDANGVQVPSGVYLYRLKADSYTETRKMMLLK